MNQRNNYRRLQDPQLDTKRTTQDKKTADILDSADVITNLSEHVRAIQQRESIRAQAVNVSISFQVHRVFEINDIAETFMLDVVLYLMWIDPGLIDVKEPDWDKAWRQGSSCPLHSDSLCSPMLIFTNEIDISLISKKSYLKEPAIGMVYCNLKYRGTFYENLELQRFPFDRQVLHIDISSFRPVREINFQHFDGRDNVVVEHVISQWLIMPNPPKAAIPEPSSIERSVDGEVYPRYQLAVCVQRRVHYFMWNVVMVLFILNLCSAITFQIDPADVSGRMGVALTLLLTVVAFKFTIDGMLPKKDYLTWLDKYFYLSFNVLTGLVAECFFVSMFANGGFEIFTFWFEMTFFFGLYGVWVAFHVWIYKNVRDEGFYKTWRETLDEQDGEVPGFELDYELVDEHQVMEHSVPTFIAEEKQKAINEKVKLREERKQHSLSKRLSSSHSHPHTTQTAAIGAKKVAAENHECVLMEQKSYSELNGTY